MKLVVQRVSNANVKVDNKIVGEIDKGFLVFFDVEIMLAPSVGDFCSEIQRSYTLCPVSMS